MASVNWYLNPHVRWMFNCGFGRVTDGPSQGNMNIFQTRNAGRMRRAERQDKKELAERRTAPNN